MEVWLKASEMKLYTQHSTMASSTLLISIDYVGSFMVMMFLIVLYSKWLNVHMRTLSTSLITIEKLKQIFSTCELPKMIALDNGNMFTTSIP